jgi:hypothetical protein
VREREVGVITVVHHDGGGLDETEHFAHVDGLDDVAELGGCSTWRCRCAELARQGRDKVGVLCHGSKEELDHGLCAPVDWI